MGSSPGSRQMTFAQWQKVKEITADALELEAPHRAGFVAAVRCLEPPPVTPLVNSDAQAQAACSCCGCPSSDHIAVRSDIDCIPRLML